MEKSEPFLLNELSLFWRSLSPGEQKKLTVKLLKPPRDKRPMGRLLLISAQEDADGIIAIAGFEEYLPD